MHDRNLIKSPCISYCVMDPVTGWCEGCLRTLHEIAAWSDLSTAERYAVMRQLPVRRKAAGAGVGTSEAAE